MNPLKDLTGDELVEMVCFPERFEIGEDGMYHNVNELRRTLNPLLDSIESNKK